jgi:AcrR family transcriptional regulator
MATSPGKGALFAELVEQEISNSADLLAVDESSPPDHVAKRLRSYLSSYHALHLETGCVLAGAGTSGQFPASSIRRAGCAQLRRCLPERPGCEARPRRRVYPSRLKGRAKRTFMLIRSATWVGACLPPATRNGG